MVTKFRGDYAALNSIANTFINQGSAVTIALHNLRAQQEQLEHGDWQGDAADRFYAEMNSSVRPALQKLANALGEAAIMTRRVARLTKEAEDTSSRVFTAQAG